MTGTPRRCFAAIAVTALTITLPLSAERKKLTFEERVEITRALMAEYATVKTLLPRTKKPLPFQHTGEYDKAHWAESAREFGPAARVGDLVQITKIDIDDDKILLEINGGPKGGRKWYDRIQVGVGSQTTPISRQGGVAQAGTAIELRFPKGEPLSDAADIKKALASVLDFEQRSASEQYFESLPPEIQSAITEKRAVEGMDKEQVRLALGQPVRKVRETKDGMDLEDWVYGQPPGKITFVTFNGEKAIQVKEAYAGLGGSVAPPLPPQ